MPLFSPDVALKMTLAGRGMRLYNYVFVRVMCLYCACAFGKCSLYLVENRMLVSVHNIQQKDIISYGNLGLIFAKED